MATEVNGVLLIGANKNGNGVLMSVRKNRDCLDQAYAGTMTSGVGSGGNC